MELQRNKAVWFFAIVAVAALASYRFSKKWDLNDPNMRPSALNVDYEMPRPKAYSKALDLSDREINRNVKYPESNTNTVNNIPQSPNQNVAANAKKAEDAKKAEADKKRKAQQAAAAKKREQERRARMQVNQVDTSRKSGMNPNRVADLDGGEFVGAAPVAPLAQVQNTEDPFENNNKLSAAQWRALMMGQPSNENISDFIAAYRKGEVTSMDFYAIVNELLLSTRSEQSSVALILLNGDPSPQAFEMLVTQQDAVTAEVRLSMQSLLNTYSNTNRFSVLSRLLNHTNPEVSVEAARLLDHALTQVVLSQDPREIRGLASAPRPQDFQVFMASLQQILNMPDHPLFADAQGFLERIQTLLQNIG